MASPFHIFRRNQRIMLALLGVLCMVAFVFLPIFSDFLSVRPPQDVLVATSQYGEIHESTLANLLQRRQMMNGFVNEARSLAIGFNMGLELFGPATEEAVVDSLLLAQRAERAGLVISDQAINQFLKEITLNRVKADQLRGIRSQLGLTQAQLFEGLRQELLAMRMGQLLLDNNLNTRSKPPAQRWDYYRRVNSRASVEMVPVSVGDYLGQAPEPTEAEITAFYEAHKNQYSVPGSPDPGFRQPVRGRYKYFKALYTAFVKPDEISAEDVQKYYEEHKDDQFLYSGTPDSDLPIDTGAVPQDTPTETPAEGNPAETSAPGGEPATETPAQDSPAEEPAPAQTPAPAAESPANEASPAEPPASETPAEPAPSTEPEGGAAGGEQSSPEPGPPASEPSPEATSPQARQAGEERLLVRGQAEEAPATGGATADALGEAAAGTTPLPGRAAAAAAANRPIGDDLMLPGAISQGADPKYDPIWKVEARIREQLAAERASQRMQTALKSIQQTLTGHFGAVAEWQVQNPDQPRPAEPDLVKLATEAMVELHETGLISAVDARLATDLGRSVVGGSEPFDQFAFGRFPVDSAQLSQDSDGNQYLFWKVEEAADRVPALEEVRAEVVLAFKHVEARKLARKRAEELAEAARQQPGKSLEEVFVGQRGLRVERPRPFSWLVFEGAQQFSPNAPPRIGEVDHVPLPGDEFMSQVFSLETDQLGVAMNQPQDTAYVLRLVRFDPTVGALRSTFLADNYRRYALAGLDDDIRLGRRWREKLESESELNWVRRPDQQAP